MFYTPTSAHQKSSKNISCSLFHKEGFLHHGQPQAPADRQGKRQTWNVFLRPFVTIHWEWPRKQHSALSSLEGNTSDYSSTEEVLSTPMARTFYSYIKDDSDSLNWVLRNTKNCFYVLCVMLLEIPLLYLKECSMLWVQCIAVYFSWDKDRQNLH